MKYNEVPEVMVKLSGKEEVRLNIEASYEWIINSFVLYNHWSVSHIAILSFGTEIGKRREELNFRMSRSAFKPKSQNGRSGAGVVMQKYSL